MGLHQILFGLEQRGVSEDACLITTRPTLPFPQNHWKRMLSVNQKLLGLENTSAQRIELVVLKCLLMKFATSDSLWLIAL